MRGQSDSRMGEGKDKVMTAAENLGVIVQSTKDTNAKKKIEEHAQYVSKMIKKKLTPLARKGKSQYKMKVPRKMSKELLNEELVDQKFKTRYQSRCGTQYIIIRW